MNSRIGKILKQWIHQITKNNLAIVRTNARLYELQLIRHHKGEFIDGALKQFNQKYGQSLSTDSIASGHTRLFELIAR